MNLDPLVIRQAKHIESLLQCLFQLLDDAQGCNHRSNVTEMTRRKIGPGSRLSDETTTHRTCQTCGVTEYKPFNALANVKKVVVL